MTPGKVVAYGGGEKLRVVNVDQGVFSARALIESTYRDYSKDGKALVTTSQWVPLTVRFLHPSYPFERVAIIPS